MRVRFRETDGLLRFGPRGPAKGQSHSTLVPWPDPDSVSIRFQGTCTEEQAKNSTCAAQ